MEEAASGFDSRLDETRLFSMKIKINASSSGGLRSRNERQSRFSVFGFARRGPRGPCLLFPVAFASGLTPTLAPVKRQGETKCERVYVYWRHGPRLAAPASAFIEHRACNSTGAPTVALPRLPFLPYPAFHISELSRILFFWKCPGKKRFDVSKVEFIVASCV